MSSHTCEVGHVVYVVQMSFFGSMWNNTLTFYERPLLIVSGVSEYKDEGYIYVGPHPEDTHH